MKIATRSRWVALTAKKLRLEVHGIEGVGDLVIVGLDLSCWVAYMLAKEPVAGLKFCAGEHWKRAYVMIIAR